MNLKQRRIVAWSLAGILSGSGAASFISLTALDAPPRSKLTIELIDAASMKPLSGLVRLETAAGAPVELEGLFSRGQGLDPGAPISKWSVVLETATVSVPAQKLILEAFSGLETEMARVTLDLGEKPQERLRVPLRRYYSAAGQGLASANTHLHLSKLERAQAERYLREIPRADGLDIVFLSYLERAGEDASYVSNGFSRADLETLSRSGVLFGNGEEHRHNFGSQDEGYGHVMLLDILKLIHPVSIGPGISKKGTDGVPLQSGIDSARSDGATTIWCHNHWGFEDVPNWLTGRLDAQNIFDGGEHGSFDESFYRYLDLGLHVPFSTGTDWFQYDFSRVYVPAARPLAVKDWLRSLAAGRSFITNGPFLELEVNGFGLGRLVRLPGTARVPVSGRAAGRADFQRIELVRNGKVIHSVASRPEGRHFVADLRLDLEITEPCWLALRIPPPPAPGKPSPPGPVALNELGQPLFAHTSAVHVELAGKLRFDRAVAEELLREMKNNVETITRKALFAGEPERERVLNVHRMAMGFLEKRLAEK